MAGRLRQLHQKALAEDLSAADSQEEFDLALASPNQPLALMQAWKDAEALQAQEAVELAEDADDLAFARGDFTLAFMIQARKRLALHQLESEDHELPDGTIGVRPPCPMLLPASGIRL